MSENGTQNTKLIDLHPLTRVFIRESITHPNVGDLHLREDIEIMFDDADMFRDEFPNLPPPSERPALIDRIYREVKAVTEEMPALRCPHCGVSFTNQDEGAYIGTSASVILQLNGRKWERDTLDMYETYQCSNCCEELMPDDLDKLGIPNEIR